jgi:hypothetical protein
MAPADAPTLAPEGAGVAVVRREWGLVLAALSVLHAGTSRAQSQATAETLPPVTVQEPTPSAKPHPLPKRHARKPPSPLTRTVAPNPSPQVTVGGSGAPNVGSGPKGTPDMASQMTVSGEDLNARPVTRPGEVLEATPGLIVTQHSGDGKANQYFLRGYNLDHGTDLAIYVDDCAGQHAHPCAWPGLRRLKLADAGNDQCARHP